MIALKTDKKLLLSFCFFALVFLCNPIVCILLQLTYIYIEKKYKEQLFSFCFFCLLFICLLNYIRVPFSDLIGYCELYKQAGKISFINYIFIWGKEPAFTLLNWILYYLLQGSVPLYKAALTFLSYSLLLYSCYRFCKANNYASQNLYLTIIAMAFIPYIFMQSIHAIRQFLAGSLLVYIAVEYIFYERKSWILIITMLLMHSSSILFIPLLFFHSLQQKICKNNIIKYFSIFVLLIGYQIIAQKLAPYLGGTIMGYAINVAKNLQDGEKAAIPLYVIALNCFTFIFLFFVIHYKQKEESKSKIRHFMNIVLILVLFILINYKVPVLSLRYAFYLWMLYPFCISYIFNYFKIQKTVYYISSISILLYLVFYIEKITDWKFPLTVPLYESSFFHYLTN